MGKYAIFGEAPSGTLHIACLHVVPARAPPDGPLPRLGSPPPAGHHPLTYLLSSIGCVLRCSGCASTVFLWALGLLSLSLQLPWRYAPTYTAASQRYAASLPRYLALTFTSPGRRYAASPSSLGSTLRCPLSLPCPPLCCLSSSSLSSPLSPRACSPPPSLFLSLSPSALGYGRQGRPRGACPLPLRCVLGGKK